MEATGCRLAMTGHGTLVIVSVYFPSSKKLLRRDLRALFAPMTAVIFLAILIVKAPGALTNYVRTIVEKRVKNVALRLVSTYSTAEHRYRVQALQRRLRACVEEVRNENRSDLIEEITKRFGRSPEHSKQRGIFHCPRRRGDSGVPSG
ncbi:hypothetical protein EVAR_98205_1 [Eumeta japonica]|uniref:Uncharacterized protein n=1 Tax=Eumeta variegata TaxID=151549 RepID=A0A4C1Y880_EUMVA|nr:hypothetical protein EVAR_98205_1 [Eumeta japonica]